MITPTPAASHPLQAALHDGAQGAGRAAKPRAGTDGGAFADHARRHERGDQDRPWRGASPAANARGAEPEKAASDAVTPAGTDAEPGAGPGPDELAAFDLIAEEEAALASMAHGESPRSAPALASAEIRHGAPPGSGARPLEAVQVAGARPEPAGGAMADGSLRGVSPAAGRDGATDAGLTALGAREAQAQATPRGENALSSGAGVEPRVAVGAVSPARQDMAQASGFGGRRGADGALPQPAGPVIGTAQGAMASTSPTAPHEAKPLRPNATPPPTPLAADVPTAEALPRISAQVSNAWQALAEQAKLLSREGDGANGRLSSFAPSSVGEGTGQSGLGAELSLASRPTAAVAAAQAASHTQGAIGGRAVVDQITSALQRNGGGRVEVMLSPAELGRVEITLQGRDGGMSISVSAERPETLELLRRHIDMLAEDMRMLGFSDLAFSFGGESAGGTAGDEASKRGIGDGGGTRSAGPGVESPAPDARPATLEAGATPGANHLDLRL